MDRHEGNSVAHTLICLLLIELHKVLIVAPVIALILPLFLLVFFPSILVLSNLILLSVRLDKKYNLCLVNSHARRVGILTLTP